MNKNRVDRLVPAASGDRAVGAVAELAAQLQRAWVAIRQRGCKSVAVARTDATGTGCDVATALVELARAQGVPVRFIDAERVAATEGWRLAGDLEVGSKDGVLQVAAVDAPTVGDGGLPLVLTADATLLVATLGVAGLPDLRRAADEIGRDRLVGAVMREAVRS